MAPSKRILRQYGSNKRLTPTERLYQLQYRIEAKGEQQKDGGPFSSHVRPTNGRYVSICSSVSTPNSFTDYFRSRKLNQQRTGTSLLPQRHQNNTSLSDMASGSSKDMLLDTGEPSEGNGYVKPAITTCFTHGMAFLSIHWPTLPAPSPPITESKNILDLEEAFLNNAPAAKTTIQAPRNLYNQPPTHYPTASTFLNLPHYLRTHILQLLLLRQPNSIIPNYNYCSIEVSEGLALNDNVDAPLLLVNKQLHAEASHVLYTENTFSFHDPHIALWFLKRIGPTNVARIRAAIFLLDTGEVNNAFGVPKEKLWRNLFAWLKSRHQLQSFVISFRNWQFDHEVTKERDQVMQVLFGYRGLKHVTVKKSEYLGRVWAERLERAMKMKEGERERELEEAIPGKRAMKPGFVFRQ